MMAVLEQRVFECLRAVDEQAAIEAVLFLGDPVAAAVLANKDDGRCRATRWRFDELHVGCPSDDEPCTRPSRAILPSRIDRYALSGWLPLPGRSPCSCSQYPP